MVKLVLVRHGQSVWNLENRFTGWVDVPLSVNGIAEAELAGKLLSMENFGVAFTSCLVRAQQTLFSILKNSSIVKSFYFVHGKEWYDKFSSGKDSKILPVFVSEKLNERMYGALQGLNKDETRQKFGEEQVKIWRRSFDVAPPEGESLKDTAKRTLPYYKKKILAELKSGKDVLVVAHGNSLRALIMFLEKMSPEQILEFELPTGVPRVYEFDSRFKVVNKYFLK